MAKTMEESMKDLDPAGAIGEDEFDNAAHEKLLNSIYALDGRKRLQNQVRGAGISSNNVDLLVHTKKESAKIKATELSLKKQNVKLVRKPMTPLETEKAKRKIARNVMETDTTKWEPVVQEIRAAPQIKYAERPKGVEMYKAMQPLKFCPRTPLEVELYEALGKSEDIITPEEPLTKAEKNALKAMSVKEAMERRKELMLHHELLSRMQIKAKRVKKIKSKRFRRGKRKEKEAQEKKKMEQLKLTDPEAFLEKMEQIDRARMEERLTLKHKNGGKFARYHKAFSKYDDTTREAVQEMIQKGKELTQKRHIDSSDDDEEEEEQLVALASKVARDISAIDDEEGGSNKISDLNSNHLKIMKEINRKAGGWLDGSTKYVSVGKQTESSNQDSGESVLSSVGVRDDATTDSSLKKSNKDSKLSTDNTENTNMSKKRKRTESAEHRANSELDDVVVSETDCSPSKGLPKKKKKKDQGHEVDVETAMEILAGDLNESVTEQNSANIKSPQRKKTEVKTPEVENTSDKGKKPKGKQLVDTVLETSETDKATEEKDKEEDDGDEDGFGAVTMEELFEDEDVVEQFARDKAEEDEKRKPKVEKVKLPGWGSWSGPDFKESRQPSKPTRRRKFQPKQKTVVDKRPNVWLNPNRDEAIRQFQPKRIPFPYVDAKQYAAANRQPVSRGFVRETAHKILVKPEVVTKLGHIIKPLDKEDFFKKDSIDMDEESGKEIKYVGPINFRQKDERLKTKR